MAGILHEAYGAPAYSKNGFDPKGKMAAMVIYGKNYSNDFFCRTTGPIRKHMGLLPI